MAVGKVSDINFETEVLRQRGLVVVDFWAEWCSPCRAIAPVLNDIADEMDDKIKIVRLNVNENPATPWKYNVKSIPTLMIFKEGQTVGRHVGVQPKVRLTQWIQAIIRRELFSGE